VFYKEVTERVRVKLAKEISELHDLLKVVEQLYKELPTPYIKQWGKYKVYKTKCKDSIYPGAWAAVEHDVEIEEIIEKEGWIDAPNPHYEEELKQWLEKARPVAEKVAFLLSFFPVKIKEKGYMKYLCSDGTYEDYDYYVFKEGIFLGALGFSVPEYQKLQNFVKLVFEKYQSFVR
jgi:hypothetical protein